MTKITVVAAVVDTRRLTLYKEDGEKVYIPQGDPRLKAIVDATKDDLLQGLSVEIDLHDDPDATSEYRNFEETTGGFARFFRVAKNKLAGVFGNPDKPNTDPVPTMAIGQLDNGKMEAALADIMANAEPATTDTIDEETETVVAVVNDKVIPGAENLHTQLAYANKMGSSEGVKNFLARISKVIDKRRHSIDDLLKFMQRGDLPIADDGSIIIYKLLKRNGNSHYVDCYSGKVPQKVGSYVNMDPSLVDPNRSQDCSNGLHVARRGYLRSFSGDVCILAKVAPEDVIAVPLKDPDKMRVCGYHILFELPAEAFAEVKRDQPISGMEGKALLAKAIAGSHPAPMEKVTIGGHYGSDIKITHLTGSKRKGKKRANPVRAAEPISAQAKEKPVAPMLDPKAVSKSATLTRKQRFEKDLGILLDEGQSLGVRINTGFALLEARSKAKKSWKAIGFPTMTDDKIRELVTNLQAEAREAELRKHKPAPKKRPARKATTKKSKPRAAKAAGATLADQARELYNRNAWKKLADFKKKKKKSWTVLGFTKAEEKEILSKI